jgi:hypothetical protein
VTVENGVFVGGQMSNQGERSGRMERRKRTCRLNPCILP